MSLGPTNNSFLGYSPNATSTLVTIYTGGTLYSPTSATNTYHLGRLTLAGGTLASGASYNSTFGSYLLNQGVTVTADSTISALGVITVNNAVTINPGKTLTVNGTFTDYSGSVQSLTLAGGGILVLAGNNTYTGATTISAGSLVIDGSGTFGSGGYAAAISNSGSLIYNSSAAQIFTGIVSGTGSLTKSGSGTLSLTGTNTYTGGTELNGGTLGVYNNSALGTGALNSAANTNVLFGRGVSTFANDMVLNGAVTFAFDQNVDFLLVGGGGGGGADGGGGGGGGGIYALSQSLGGLTSTVTVGAGGAGGVYQISNSTNGSATSITNISGSAYTAGGGVGAQSGPGINKEGVGGTGNTTGGAGGAASTGQNTLGTNGQNGGTSTITGTTIYYGGGGGGGIYAASGQTSGGLGGGGNGATWASSASSSGYNGSANTGGGGGGGSAGYNNYERTPGGSGGSGIVIVRYKGGVAGTGGTISSGTGTATGYTVQTFTSNGTLTLNPLSVTLSGNVSGAGSMVANAANGTFTMTGTNNTYTGATNVTAGTFNVSGGGLSASTAVNVSSGAIYNVLVSNTVGSIAGAGNMILGNGYTLTAGGDNTTTTFSGCISGSGNLVKAGTGTLTLSGTNTYSGNTTISGGMLSISADSNLGPAPGSTTAGKLVLDGGTLATTASFTLNANRGIALNINGGTFNQSASTTLSYAGIIAGAGSLTKAGAGTMTLSTGSNNTYTGSTNVTNGTLNVSGSLADTTVVNISSGAAYNVSASDTIGSFTGDGTINLVSGTLTAFGDNSSAIYGGVIAGAGSLTKAGTGTLTLTGTNTYAGATTISAGALQIGNGTANGSITGTSSITDNGTLIYNRSDAVTLSKVISGTGNLTQTGSGTLTLSGANTYIGSTNVTAGTLAVSGSLADSTVVNVSSGAVYNVSVTDTIGSFTGDGTISVVAQHTLRAFGDNSDETFSGVIVGEGSLEKLGTGTLTLAGTNTYAGSTTISNGTLVIGGNGSLGSGTYGGFVVNNGNFIYNSTTNQSLSNRMSGTGNLTQNGTGTLTLSLDPLFNNTYTGNTTINGGVLRISSDGQLGNTTSQLVLNGGTLWTTANLTLNVSRSVILGANGGTFDQTTGTALTYAGVIDGAASLNKVGMGTLTLSGANTYTGATNVSAGAFNVSGTLADTTTVNVSSGATYNVLSNDTIASFSGAGSITLGNGNTLTAFSDNSSASYGGDLSGAGGFTKAGTGTLTLTGTNTYTGTTTIDAGTLQLGDSGTTGSIAGSVVNNGMLVFNRSNAVTMNSSQIISGSGNLTQAGLGTLTLSGANTYSGITSINNGVLVISSDGNLGEAPVSATADSLVLNGGTLQTTANFSLNANRSISLGANGGTFLLNSSTLTYSGVIAGTGNLTKTGSGTLTLSGANTFSGITTIKSGNLSISSDSNLGAAPSSATAGKLVLDGGTLLTTANLTLDANRGVTLNGSLGGTFNQNANTTLTHAGVIDGTGKLIKAGQGTLVLSGTNTFSGVTSINNGVLSISSDRNLGVVPGIATTGSLVLNGGTLQATANFSLDANRGVALNSSIAFITVDPSVELNYAGVVAGSNKLQKDGSGTLTLSGNNSYTGGTIIHRGILSVSSDSNLGAVPGAATAGQLTFGNGGGVLLATAGFELSANRGVDLGTSGGTLRTDSGVALAYAGVIANSGSLAKAGSGTLTLTGTNTYNGATNISAGSLVIDGSGSLRSGSYLGAISNNGRFVYNSSAAQTLFGVISGTGNLTLNGTGTLMLTGNSTYTGTTTINSGTLQLGNNSAAGSVTGSIVNNGTLVLNRSNALTLSQVVSGSGNLIQNGSGTVTLSGANTYSGITSINNGVLAVSSDDSLGTAPGTVTADSLVLNGGTLQVGGVVLNANRGISLGTSGGTFTVDGSLTYAGVIAGTGSLTKSGAGKLTLTGTNAYTGTTTINAGTLQLGNNGTTGSIDSTSSIVNNDTLLFYRSDSFTFSHAMAGTGNLAKYGSGTLTLSGTNTYSGTTTIGGGVLAVSSDSNLGSAPGSATAGNLVLNNGTLQATASFDLNANRGITLTGTGTFAIDPSVTLNYAGVIASTGNLVKSGSGTLTLSGTNTYNGTMNINAGALVIDGGGSLGSGSYNNAIMNSGSFTYNSSAIQNLAGVISGTGDLTQAGSGTLTLTGTNTYTGTTNVSAGTLQIGNGGTAGSVNGSSAVNISSGATLVVNRSDNVTLSNAISGAGNLSTVGSNVTTLTGAATYTGTTNVTNGSIIFTNNVAPATSGFAGNGSVTIQPTSGSSFSSDLASNYSFANTLTGLTLGSSTNTANISIDSATSIAGNVAIYGGNVAINNAMTATSSGIIRLQATSGSVTQGTSGNITTTGLALLGGDATLTNANNVTTLAAESMGNLSYVNAGNLTIGTVNPIGVNATGVVTISTNNGDLIITEAIRTTSTASDAITLIANASAAAGTATGGNILISGNASGNGNISAGSSGRATLYTGSVANSTGVTALVGSGTGRFRYGSNATVSNYTTALGTGIYAVYREAPSLTITANSSTITYGTAATIDSSNTAVNGDSYTQIFGSSPTFNITGSKSSSDNWIAGNHTIVADGSTTNLLGYAAPTYVNGTLTVNQATLTVTGTQVANKVYDGNTTAVVSNGNLSGSVISGDSVSLSQSGNFSSKNVGTNLNVTINDSISGTDATNYVLTQPTGLTANITQRTVNLSANQVYSGSNVLTNVSIVTGVAGETLTYTGATANSSHVADNSTNYITAITLGDQVGANATSGGLASNYQLPSLTAQSANNTVTISAAQVTLTAIGNLTKVYDGTANSTVGSGNYNVSGLISGDSLTLNNLTTAAYNDAHVANASSVTVSNLTLATVSGNHSSAVSDYNLQTSNLTWGTGGPVGTNANMTAKTLTVTGTIVANKVYDGNTTAAVSNGTLVGTVAGDMLTLTQNGNFSSANAANNISVSASDSFTITSSNHSSVAGDYNLVQPTGLKGNITQRTVNLSANQVYSGSNVLTNVSIVTGVAGETLSYTAATANSSHVADNATNYITNVTLGNGSGLASNYQLPNMTVRSDGNTVTLQAAQLTLTAAGNISRAYDGTANASVAQSNYQITGLISGDTAVALTNSNAIYNDAHVAGATSVTASGIAISNVTGNLTSQASDYVLSTNSLVWGASGQGGTNANITAKTLTVTGTTVANKVYDGNTIAALSNGTLVGTVDGDVLTLHQSGNFSNANAANNISVIASDSFTITNSNYTSVAGDYNLVQPTGLTGNITKRTVTLSDNQTYSGSTTLTNVSIGNLVGNETLAYAGNAYSKNFADNGTNYIANLTLSNGANGGLASNYELPTLNVTNAPVTITRLNTVTWIGGSSGNWFDPANWAGGAVPDLNNVANVVIPGNVTVLFNSNITPPAQAGTVSIDSLGSALGNLTQTEGTLNVGAGGITLNTLTQSGGNLSSQGNVTLTTFDQSNGSSAFGGNLTTTTYLQSGGTTTTNGSLATQTYNQSGGSSTVNGTLTATDYIQSNGTNSVTGNLTTTNMTLTGGTTDALSNLTVSGTLDQQAGNLSITGNTSAGNVSLSGGNMTAQGNMVAGNLSQSNGTLIANNNLTVNGSYNLSGGNSTVSGNLATQTFNQSGGSSTVNGTLTATDYVQSNGTNSVTGNLTTTNWTQSGGNSIALGNLTVNGSYHQTGGQTNVTGNANITTTGTITLGNLTIGGTLLADSTAGSINQTAGTRMSVTGLATFYAPNGVIALNPNNSFPGGNSIIDQNGDRNRPKDVWVYQQSMVQGGTMVYIPLPKLQVAASKKSHQALAFTGDVVLLDDETPENATDPGFMAQPEAGFTDRFFGSAPRITLLPETDGRKLVQHGDRLFIVNTESLGGPRGGITDEDVNLLKPSLNFSKPDEINPV